MADNALSLQFQLLMHLEQAFYWLHKLCPSALAFSAVFCPPAEGHVSHIWRSQFMARHLCGGKGPPVLRIKIFEWGYVPRLTWWHSGDKSRASAAGTGSGIHPVASQRIPLGLALLGLASPLFRWYSCKIVCILEGKHLSGTQRRSCNPKRNLLCNIWGRYLYNETKN